MSSEPHKHSASGGEHSHADKHTQVVKSSQKKHDHPHDDHNHDAPITTSSPQTKPGHEHDDHDEDEGHGHDHAVEGNFFRRLIGGVVHSHAHDDEGDMGRYMAESERGIWALKISLAGLAVTAIFQLVIVFISGSAALLADTIHNFSDALTAIPLWIAFVLGRRQATKRYTYGYGRAEDLAGLFVVLMIFLSAVIALYESLQKLINPQPVSNIAWVIAAAIIGFVGNEAVAWFRIKVGTEIGSAALVADGQHARIDGLTSLAVLFGAIGVLLGFPQADPIVGLLISLAILLILKDTVVTMYRRMMDAVEPDLVDKIEIEAGSTEGVLKVHGVRGRWIGHKLFAELSVEVKPDLSVMAGHAIGEEVRHRLWHKFPRLADITIHVDPTETEDGQHHQAISHHLDGKR